LGRFRSRHHAFPVGPRLPLPRLEASAQHPDHSRFAGTIWPEKAEDRPFSDGKRNVIDSRERAETLRQTFALDHRLRHRKKRIRKTGTPETNTKNNFLFSCFPDYSLLLPDIWKINIG